MGFEWLLDPQLLVALVTLTALEIVLGVDNIIFISILVGRLPEHQRARARTLGLGLAMLSRIALLLSLAWMMGLTETLFTVMGQEISWRDIILGGGGLFLLAKSTMEIHASLEGEPDQSSPAVAGSSLFIGTLVQIAIIDIVFSLDSVITAVGMVQNIPVMVTAIMIAVGVMLFAAGPIGDFVDRHPTVKILALSFLILVGTALIAEALDFHVPKGYIYFAMAFSVVVEMINLRLRKKFEPVDLHKPLMHPDEDRAGS